METKRDNMIQTRCIVCGITFWHCPLYETKTCNNFNCTHKYIHNKEFYHNIRLKGGGASADIPTLDKLGELKNIIKK
jgi:hypothetical protein